MQFEWALLEATVSIFFYLHIHRNSLKLYKDLKYKQIHKDFIAHRKYVEQSTVCDLMDWERHKLVIWQDWNYSRVKPHGVGSSRDLPWHILHFVFSTLKYAFQIPQRQRNTYHWKWAAYTEEVKEKVILTLWEKTIDKIMWPRSVNRGNYCKAWCLKHWSTCEYFRSLRKPLISQISPYLHSAFTTTQILSNSANA